MAIHKVKILEDFALKHHLKLKPWELRKNDRDYKVGDAITFSVIDKDGLVVGSYTRRIEYIFEGGEYGLEKGFVIMTLGNPVFK